MNREPLVSVIIPTFKRPDTLARAVNSVLKQTYKNIEIIVVDDNNPDSEGRILTEEVMNEFADNDRVRYIKHEKNKNGSAARNTGFRNSYGEYIAFFDDDDVFLPRKIASQVKKLESLSTEWGVCYSQYYTQKEGEPKKLADENREGNLFLLALKQDLCVNAGSNLLIRRSAVEAINGFDESFKRNQDHEFLVRLLQKYKIAYVDEPGLIYSVGTTNVEIDYDATITHYINTFKDLIDTLSPDDRREFYDNVAKLRFYHQLRYKRNYKKALGLILRGDITLGLAISHLFSLTKNFIEKKIK